MCDAVSAIAAAGVIVSVGSKIMDDQAQQQAHDDNAHNAIKAAQNSQSQLSLRQMQEKQATAGTIYQMDLAARHAQAMTNVAAGENGVAGTSVDLLLADIERQKTTAETGAQRNLSGTLDQIEQQKTGLEYNKLQQINAVPAPNHWATAVRIGGTTLDAAGNYLRNSSEGSSAAGGALPDTAKSANYDEASAAADSAFSEG